MPNPQKPAIKPKIPFPGSIVLFAKESGLTSFSSLYAIKKALKTSKVGHTGTLDSFASGLLVACTDSLTKLASKITDFDKEYEAVVVFGRQTDTLECTGKVVKTCELPREETVCKALEHFRGELLQRPPEFCALHVDGNRASDLVRQGFEIKLPERPVIVYSSKITEIQKKADKVSAARIKFHVSKGTYIRSLARDIGEYSGSCAYLAGLRRTRVGNFLLEDAAGFERLDEFNIKNVFNEENRLIEKEKAKKEFELKMQSEGIPKKEWNKFKPKEENSFDNAGLYEEIIKKSLKMDFNIAENCGFDILKLNPDYETSFYNGAVISPKMFFTDLYSVTKEFSAVFNSLNDFVGLIKFQNNKFGYAFVLKV